MVARIHQFKKGIELIRSEQGDVIPSHLGNKQLESIVANMSPGDEAVIEGHVIYQAATLEGPSKFTPIFVIDSIKPISLKKLSSEGVVLPATDDRYLFQKEFISSRYTIPLSTEVATSITMTAATLMMSSLAASPEQTHLNQQLNQSMIIFAGALATGVFIYEQINDQIKKGKTHD